MKPLVSVIVLMGIVLMGCFMNALKKGISFLCVFFSSISSTLYPMPLLPFIAPFFTIMLGIMTRVIWHECSLVNWHLISGSCGCKCS